MTVSPNLSELLQQGHDQLDGGNYHQALDSFYQAAALEPQNPQVLYGLGLACYRLERYQDAIGYCNQALTIEPNYILALARRGLTYKELEQIQLAQADFEQVIALIPQDAGDWHGRGIALNGLERYEEAIASYDKAIEIKPDYRNAWYSRGITLSNLGRYEEAIASYDKAVEIKPDYHIAWNNRGNTLSNLGRYEEAIASCDKAIEIKPKEHLAWHNRGNALWNLGRNQEAFAAYDKVIEIKPDYYYAWNGRGSALWNLGKHQEALASYDKAIAIKADEYNPWNGRGNALVNLGRNQEALTSYDKAIAIKADEYNPWNGRGNALVNLGRNQEALASYDKAIAIKADEYNPWNGRGNALVNLGRNQEALTSYDKAIAIKADEYNPWNGRGNALVNLGRNQEALTSYDKAIAIKADEYNPWNGRGNALVNLGQNQEALTSYDKAIAIEADEYNPWNGRGNALVNLGQNQEALTSYDKAIAIEADEYNPWNGRGNALVNLGQNQEALTSYDKAIAIEADEYNPWNGRGNALVNLGQNQEALASYDKAIAIKAEKHLAWNGRGNALVNLGRNQEALTSYDKAIAIKAKEHLAWNGRGNALVNLGRYQEALASYDQALHLTNNQYWLAWDNRGIAVLKSQDYKAAVKTWHDGINALKSETPEYEIGCGKLHHRKGAILYNYGKLQPNPFPDWFAAKASYEQALNFLSFDKFPQLNLQILEELLQVCSVLGDNQAFKKRQEEATQKLEELVVNCQTKDQEISLRRKFAAFNQLRIDLRLKSKNKQQHIEALELAEERKNICLAWLREGWDYQPRKFTYQDMQRLLNPKTAAVYWHVSPIAITTFIVKHKQPPVVLQPQLPDEFRKQGYPPHTYQLLCFQNWIQEWKQAYQDYSQGNYTGTAKESAPWRENMEYMLQNQLRNILEINRIRDELKGVEELILIPHRELHLLPLDYLFPERFNITYLPSFQIGLKLLAQENQFQLNASQNIVNVATSDLPFATIESVALSAMYPRVRQLQIPPVKPNNLIAELQKNRGLFHFTGHSDHIPEEPRESFLMLSDSDKLTLGNIVDDDNIDLSQYAVICLSSCETGITSSETLTDEYVGLVSGFLAKGANYVVSTLWRVDERSTAILMIKFYELLKTAKSPSIALRKAKQWLSQLTYQDLAVWYKELAHNLPEPQVQDYLITEAKMIENDSDKMNDTMPVYAHPYYWAGFILTGKPV
ncbi:tetratricopeptide repeat protein [Calothrix sp. FACHB-156]|nr:tetratricopeptide repeat protein [Calothrix sp. FACHB-156]